MQLDLSIVIPARDRAATIARAVAGALRLGADVVVVDTGSSDDTATRAADAGARVISLAPEAGSFAAARNAGAEAARGAWLLHLGSDETVAPGYLPAIQRAIAARAFDVHDLPLGNLRSDGTRSLVTQRRLYRNGAGFSWVGLTCEWVYPLVPAGTLDVIIDRDDDSHGGQVDAEASEEARAQREHLMTTEVQALLRADLATQDLGQFISRCRHLTLQGRALLDTTGLAQRAGEAFQRFCQHGESSDQPRLELARLHELHGDPARALVLYTGLPLAAASPSYLAHQAACIFAVTRDVEAALAAIDAAIARAPCALFLLTRGSILGAAGRPREAAAAVVEALRRLPALRHYTLGPPG